MARPLRVEFPGANRLLHIGNGSAVSRQLAKLRDRLEADRTLKKRMETAQGELERLRQGISRK